MALTVGDRLGRYEILAPLGAGGMGEVYRARDERLDRDVAVKVLPDEVAQDEARLARFEREAKLLASLSHQNIATLHGLEEVDLPVIPSEGPGGPQPVILRSEATKNLGGGALSDRQSPCPDSFGSAVPASLRTGSSTRGAGAPLAQDDTRVETRTVRFLVMEVAEGETLAERIKKGAIPVEDALPIALQIAEGLEAAHEQGIIHRDLKPANVMLSPEGKVKILDFGLAKAWAPEESDADLTHSPTLTAQMTAAGVLLGTAAYMSPEQARGKPVDRRADIWAFGVVLWEMLTGRRLFTGETTTDVLSNILKTEPDWQTLPSATPWTVQHVLRRCLAKDPRQRFHDIADARIEIDESITQPAILSQISANGPPRKPRSVALIVAVTALLTAIATGIIVRSLMPTSAPGAAAVTRLAIDLPSPVSQWWVSHLAISPDGSHVVYAAEQEGNTQLFLREMDRLDAQPIPGTEGGDAPFFSPDGRWIGFFTLEGLKKVPVAGGKPVTLCEAPEARGGCWAPDGTILFTTVRSRGLWKIPAAGGTPQMVAAADPTRGERELHWPRVLPGGEAVLVTVWTGDPEKNFTAALSLETGERSTLIEGATGAQYAPTGYLVFARKSSVLAAPFDLDRLAVTGGPVPVLDNVENHPLGAPGFSFSGTGSLVYVLRAPYSVVWVDRDGTTQPVLSRPSLFPQIRLSPTGDQLAVVVDDDIWVYDFERETLSRITFDPGSDVRPVWTPDGKWLTFSSTRGGGWWDIYRKPTDGSGPAEPLLASEFGDFPTSWSPDGKALAFFRHHTATGYDIWVLPLDGEQEPRPFADSAFNELEAQFSPDGRWLAYSSDESGQSEVYVRPYPGPGAKVQISTEGGDSPVWAPTGTELYYRNGNRMMVVATDTGPGFAAGRPGVLFEIEGDDIPQLYDIAPDGERFVMARRSGSGASLARLNVVLNWFEELKRLVPTDR